MPLYECTFIARQDLSKQDVTKLAETFASVIENGGGKIVKNEYWGLKSLAYKIEKTRKGHYNMLGLDTPADALKEMERQMRINENIIRVLTVRVDQMDAAPSVMMNQSRGRDDYAAEGEIVSDDAAIAESK